MTSLSLIVWLVVASIGGVGLFFWLLRQEPPRRLDELDHDELMDLVRKTTEAYRAMQPAFASMAPAMRRASAAINAFGKAMGEAWAQADEGE